MPDLSIKKAAGIVAVGSYVIFTYAPGLLLFSRPTLVGAFLQSSVLTFIAWAFYMIILWPKFLSPLRHLPEPSVGGLFITRRISDLTVPRVILSLWVSLAGSAESQLVLHTRTG